MGASQIANLTPEQLAQLQARLKALKSTQSPAAGIPRRADTGPAPLSFAQQRIWFQEQARPGGSAFNLALAVRLRGALDVPALERTMDEIVRRHEVLRTTFALDEDGPVQVVHADRGAALRREAMPDGASEDDVLRRARAEVAVPFDLARDTPLRALLLRAGPAEHVLVLVIHHIAADKWSFSVLLGELAALYGAFAAGAAPSVSDLSLQYADFAAWQRERLAGSALDASLAFWTRHLQGVPTTLAFPADFAPAEDRFELERHPLRIPPALAAAVRETARAEGATPYAVLLAAYSVLLARWCGQDELLVGSLIANRHHAGTERLLGTFANLLVLRAAVADGTTFRGLVGTLRETLREAQRHQDLPFERLVEAVAPARGSRTPLVQTALNLSVAPKGTAEVAGLELEVLPVVGGTAGFDFYLVLEEDGEGFSGVVEYNAARFAQQTIARVSAAFERLLAGGTARPETRLDALDLLGDADRARIAAFHRPASEYPRDLPLHALFEAQAARTPDRIALAFRDQSLTYAELDARADSLALRLRRMGVGPERRVGLLLERSAEMVAAALAVLKAGGAYVPLDASFPAPRLAWIAEDADLAAVVAHASLQSLSPLAGDRLLVLDGAGEWTADGPDGRRSIHVDPSNAAYLLYTSGSTGQPKGVAVQHRSVVNFLASMRDTLRPDPDGRLLSVTRLGFDISVLEIFLPLMAGGCVEIADSATAADGRLLAERIGRGGIDAMQATPATWQMLVDAGWHGAPGFTALCGGEALPAPLARRLTDGGATLWNLYGPTETTIWSAALRVEAVDADGAVPLGAPIANTSLYVLDRGLRPVLPGAPGELCIGGEGLARGYRNRPALTAEKFVPDPFSPVPGARMYRTGDLARMTECVSAEVRECGSGGECVSAEVRECGSGSESHDASRAEARGHEPTHAPTHSRTHALQFLGRADHQVKVRGFRVEPGEIEAALLRHPSIARAAVVARGEDGSRTLAAYVVRSKSTEALDVDDVLRTAAGLLPPYMVPAVVEELDALPLNANGKVDRRALLERTLAAPAAAEYVAPRTPLEALAADTWAAVLGVERVGIHDGFFARGGHSLMATRVVIRLQAALGVDVPLRAVFETDTLADFAARVEALARGEAASADPIVPVPRDAPLPLSFSQERLWFLDRLEPENPFYNIPAALRLRGALHAAAMERALGELVRRHEALRTTLPAVDGVAVQAVAPFAGFTLPVEDLSGVEGADRDGMARRLAADEAARPFDLAAGPLFRARLLRLAGDEHLLLLTMHHAVSDGWSVGVLVRELSALYGAFRDGRGSPLPEPALHYGDYAAWQRARLRGPVLDAQLAWWRERLAGAPALLELPTDHPRPAVQSYRGAFEAVELPGALSEALRALGRREAATLFMVLLAGFKVLLSRYAGTPDVVAGTPVAGRTRREVEGIVGLFMNTLALRTDLSGDPSFREVLGRVRETLLAAHDHQEVPFDRLVAELQPDRTLSHSPVVQVLFELLDGNGPGELPGLRTEVLETELRTAKLDLALTLVEQGGGVRGMLGYRTDLWERPTARRMLAHLLRVLEQAADDADRPVSRLSLADAGERARVVAEWNRTEAAYPAAACIHQLFEQQARRTPDAVAVRFGAERMTFAELDAAANQLAHHLRRLGVGPDVRVGICLERGLEMMPAILGVMKAGGAYVPVDPGHPAERQGYVFADSGAALVLTQARLAERLPLREGVPVLALDAMAGELAAERADAAPETGVTSENLCYAIYTSGSTGRPKGVAMHHRGVVNYIDWGVRFYGADAGQGAPVFSSMAVDLTITNLLPLFAGRPIHLLPEENPLEALADALRTGPDFGLIKITPVHLSLLTPMLTAEEARTAARALVIGADVLPAELTVWWQDNAPHVRLMNEYGPTETVVGCSAYELPTGVQRTGPVAVGGPIQNLTFYVLDAHGEPVPVGLPGELYIGGAGVARGYLGRPALSAEKFVPDPFAGPGARMYRTGDRARWMEGGNLMILGRTDNQVKVRGYRVELGEIEAVLRRQDGVAGVLVVVREDRPGDRRLVAYVVGGAETDALRAALRASLPEYMVPGAFVRLESLPRTATGKIDPRTLPAPEYGAGAEAWVAPRTPAEQALADIWAELLRAERVGVHDNFFDLGGDSILSIQVVSKARRAGLPLSPRDLFEHPTVAALAAAASERGAADETGAEQGRVDGSVRLTPIQAWHLDHAQPAPAHYNQSVLLEVDPSVGDDALRAALDAVLAHHDALRLRFRRTESGWEQWHADDAGIALERVDLSALPDDEARDRAQARAADERQAGLDLEHGPLGRAVLFDRGARGRALLLVIHHLVVDGVSWRILREDLEQACAQAQRGEAIGPGVKSTSFRQWSQALEAFASTGALAAQAEFWQAQGTRGVAPLPVDGEGDGTAGGARSVTVALDEEETRALLQDVPAAYRTQINDVLLAALAQALGDWTGSPRVRIALEGHGREEEVGTGIDLTRTVGWFTSVYPLVLDLSGADGPGARLRAVKEQLRAVPLRGIGHGVLRWLSPDAKVRRRLAGQAEPQVVFNYLGQFDQGTALAERLRFADGPRGAEQDAGTRRRHLLEVNGGIAGGCLQMSWTYGEGTHRRETIQRVADAFVQALRALIAHCRAAEAGGWTPSDFPLAELSQAELDAALGGRRDVEDLYPLSPLQEGLLFHAVSGASQAYQAQAALRLEGPLDVALLRRAWDEVAARHPILRTSFVWEGLRRPLQRVHASAEVPWTLGDWSGLAPAQQDAALERFMEDDRVRGYVLREAPLMRCALFRADGGAHWLVWSRHHLLTDGWASTRILNDVFRLYTAWSAGAAPELGRPRPFRDYVAWLRRQDPAAAERYWRGVLAGFGAPTPLGLDRAPRPDEGVLHAIATAALPEADTRRLEEAARQARVTLNTVVQGAWALLMSRYAGEDDVVFGVTVAGRPAELEGVDDMVGVFINTLPLRVRVRGDAPLGAWLAEVQRAQAALTEYEYAPLAQVQEWSGVPRGTPLFESHYIFQNYPVRLSSAGGGATELRLAGHRAVEWSTYPLSLVVEPGPRLTLSIKYDASRLDAPVVNRILDHLRRVLAQAAADPGVRLSRLDLPADDERARLAAWSGAEGAYAPRPLHHLVAEQVERMPDAAALAAGGRTVTYRALDEAANRLAHHLAARGAGPETLVGVVAERTPETAVAMLAVLRAGAAYLPLDPAYPADRLRYMLADSGAGLVVHHGAPPEALRGAGVPAAVDTRAEADAIAARPATAPEARADVDHLAYVIYTSGSTGRPKGVAVTHRGVPNLAAWKQSRLGQRAGDRALQFASFSFDAAVEELFGALLTGSTLVMAGRDALMPGEPLRETLRRERVTFATLPPSALAVMDPADFPDLRVVVSAGEALPPAVAARWAAAVELHNAYGPTETTVSAASGRVAPDGGAVPIGRPLENVRAYVLDGAGLPAPQGVPGELHLGGVGVARGYLNRPALTAERFVPDPFAARPGARLYRTGDRVRWIECVSEECVSAEVRECGSGSESQDVSRTDARGHKPTDALTHSRTHALPGALEFLGRLDEQVKLRGFRIELGEIEAVLRRDRGVADCAAVIREDAPGQKRLVAYFTGAAPADALRAQLEERLPEHMVPGALVRLDALPRTPNGKLDRRALPAPEDVAGEGAYVAPRNPVEEALAGIWAEVLQLDRVGVEESFFELGGDSILSIQVVSRARRAGLEVTPHQMFEYETIAELASVVGRIGAAEEAATEDAAEEGSPRPTPIQAWYFAQRPPRPAHYNQSVLLEVDGAVPDAALEAALSAVLARHDALRLRFRPAADGTWEQWMADASAIALERIDLSALDAGEQDRAQAETAQARQTGLDLEAGPLGRAVLFDRGARGRVLLIVIHHLAVDGVSWRILREDLELACAQAERGETVDLGAKSTPHGRWARALETFAASGALADEAAYWLAQGPDGAAPLPVDGTPVGTIGAARSVSLALDADETRALLQEVPAAYRTQINDVLLAALAETVGAWTGTPRVRISLEGHGREEEIGTGIDLTRTVGWFTSVYPVVLDVTGAAGPGDRLKRVKEQLRSVPLRGIGYGVLRHLSPDAGVRAALAAQAEPEIGFNYLGQFDQGIAAATRFRFAGGERGVEVAPENPRPHLLEVGGAIAGGCLQLSWTYDEGAHRPETVERLAQAYLDALRGLIAHCRQAGAGGWTPSDFPLAALSQAELDGLLDGRRNVEDLYPLSPMQEGMLFHALHGDAAQAYHAQVALRLEGALDVDVFRRAWAEVVARHAVLRTAFVWEGAPRPLQRVDASAPLAWTEEDWSGVPAAEHDAALRRWLDADRAAGFRLDDPPLMRHAVLRLGPDSQWIVWSHHHLMMDGWAAARVVNEVFRLYAAWSTGGAVELARVRPYRDYIGWLRRQDLGAAERYWRGVLAGFATPTALPSDPAAGEASAPRGEHVVRLPAESTERLERAARGHGVTLSTVLQGAWGLLLSRYGGEDDVVFGTTVSGRPPALEGVEEMVGLFINTLPVRLRVRGGDRLGAWLGGLQRAQAEMREYEFSPLVQVQGWSDVPRGVPLFDTHYIFENYPVERAGTGTDTGLRVADTRAVEWNTYPLSLMGVPGEQLELNLRWDTTRLGGAVARRMLEQLARVLEQVADGGDPRLAELDLLGADERQALVDWDRTEAPYSAGLCIHHLFEAQARRTPDAVAVTFGAESLTFAELDARANRLANHLRGLGIGPEVKAGLCLERGLEMMACILGVMKAGGAYVPVDPSHPSERIGYVFEDSGVSVVLTQARLAGRLPVRDGVPVLAVDAMADALAQESAEAPESGATSENLCYVIYTSGSTGRPKGVAMHHRGVVNYIEWGIDYYGSDEGGGSPVFSSMAVDLTITNLLALFAGKPVHFLPEENAVEALADALRARPGYGAIKITPVHLSLLTPLLSVDEARAAAHTLVVGADFLPAEPTVWWQENAPDVRLMNEYGPTETVVGCSAYVLPNGLHRHGAVPVGGPIQNLTFHVLDGEMRPLPAGVPGELYIGGAGVARGYLGRPGLSAEKFVPDPFMGGGARMYRTGDRARWMEGGNLMILGRTDNQVKVRGYRVELGEIEAVIRRQEGVSGALVVLREDVPGDRRLVAYVAGEAETDALRAALRTSLPEYMVPSAFVHMDTLPKTVTGKIDPKTLPAPDYAVVTDEARYVAPRTPVEQALADIWADALRRDRVGVEDSFFELGGDSILSIQVVSRARRAGLMLSPRHLFEHPTIAGLAAVVEQGGAAQAGGAEQGRVDGSVRLTPIQAWYLEHPQPAPAHYNQSVLLEVDPSVADGALGAAVDAVLAHHDALRLRFRRTDAGWEQWHAEEAGIALERVDLSALDDDAQDRAQAEAASERQAGLDLEHGPVGRAVLFDRGARGRVLLLVLHHLVVDGVSWRILREDLEQACEQAGRGETLGLGVKSTSYRQWSAALQAAARGDALAAEAAFWLAQDAAGVAPLPLDGAGDGTVGGARSVAVSLDEEETRALLQDVPAAYRTQINDVLLAALAASVSEWTGSPRVRISLEGHGREEEIGTGIDLTRTVGWFTSVYPLVLDVAGAAGPGERLKRVKEQLRAVPLRGIGYGVLRHLSPDEGARAALAAQAEPEIIFNYLGQFDQGIASATRLRFAAGPRGAEVAPSATRRHLLEVNGGIAGGQLQLSWTYGEGTHRRETIQRVADAFVRALRGIIAHCGQADAGGWTPSDFPLAELSQAQLDAALGGRRDVEDLYPLSPLQEGLLFHALYSRDSYQAQAAHRLEGALDVPLLRRAWAEVVARHAVLRTSFVTDGVPHALQRVHAAAEVPWTLGDWTGMPEAEQDAALARFLDEDRARGFALDDAPLMRCALFRADGGAHWFVWTRHHLLTDGWASTRIINEVFQAYAAWSAGAGLELPRVRPYRDYIAWLRRQDLGAAERYWRGALAGFTTPTPLPADRVAGGDAPAPRGQQVLGLSEASTERLERAARGHGVTLSTVVQGAWGLLLSRYGGEDDVVFGTTVSGRPPALEGVEEMVGLFINTLPVRLRVRGGDRLGAWLGELQRAQAEMREYEFSPLVQVQGWSDVPRGVPLFDTHYIFENYPVERAGTGGPDSGLRVTSSRAVEWNTYPLSLMGVPGRQLELHLHYDAARLGGPLARRMLEQLARVLEQVSDGGDPRLAELDLLGAEERQALVDWNRTEAPYSAELCIHQLFEAQARRTPDAVAVVFGAESLTFAELNARANRLANHLRGLGIGPEVKVGLCLERGLEMMACILGVMKAGGAYVPVDPSHPGERIGYVFDDSAVSVVLTQARLAERLPIRDGIPVLAIDDAWDRIAQESAEAPESGATSENLCYVIYTSGSTGRPKGVAMHHRGVVNYIEWGIPYYGSDEGGGSPVFSSMAVDLTITNLLALFAGKPVRFLPEENAVEALAAVLREKPGFGAIKITPVHLALLTPLLTADEARAAAHTLVVGADFLPAEPTVWWQENAPGVRLMNEYGPTETVVGCSAYILPNGLHRHGAVPVGGPIQNLTFHVLDGEMRPLPAGVPGELYIGGAGVARGYLGRPALSAEKFVPDPFLGGGARMYRTGDRARWMDGGNLMILGRTDNQVKVRGYRVELGEIEAVIRRQEGVSGALVVLREDVPGDRRLVAYVAGEAETDALRAALRGTLPEYMVPSAFVHMDTLPKTVTGKIDPKTLPAPDYAAEAEAYAAPRTPVEEVLAGMWAELLSVERVGVDDGFFALGGHSLLATRVASRVREVFGVELPLRVLFDDPTVAGCAAWIESRRGARAELPPIEHVAEPGEWLPLSFAQQRLWLVHQMEGDAGVYHQSVGFRLRGALDVPALERTLTEIVRRHAVFRTRFVDRDGVPGQVIDPAAPVHLPVVDLSPEWDPAAALAERVRLQEHAPFDLERGALLRVLLARTAADEHALVATMHHITSDGWSAGILFREVAALYAAFAEGRPSPLPEPALQYADYAVWQRAWLTPERERAQLDYWRGQLRGAPRLKLATDRAQRPEGTAGAAHDFALDPALSEGVRALARGLGATPFMLLLAAFKTLLRWQGGGDDVVVGTDIANRNLRAETEGLIGFFVNQLVLRTGMEGDPPFAELVARVRAGTLAAYDHQDVPFDRVVEALQPPRAPGETPFFRVKFVLQNAPESGAAALPGLALEALASERGAAQLDVLLAMHDGGERMTGAWEYRTGLFSPELIARWTRRLETVLRAVTADPGTTLDALGAALDAEERREDDGARAALQERRKARFTRR